MAQEIHPNGRERLSATEIQMGIDGERNEMKRRFSNKHETEEMKAFSEHSQEKLLLRKIKKLTEILEMLCADGLQISYVVRSEQGGGMANNTSFYSL